MSNAIKNFEDLECWKKARELVKSIYQLTNTTQFSKDFGLRDQIQRASVSVMANIAEGFENFSDQETIRFLRFSLRSCSEVRSHLYTALDLGYITTGTFSEISNEAMDCSNLLKGFLRYLQRSKTS